MYLEEWALERESGASVRVHADCWGIHRSTHWRWLAGGPQRPGRRKARLPEERVQAVLELDRRYRSSWDVRALGHAAGIGKTSVARIVRQARGPRPKVRPESHKRRTRFLVRDVMWSSDYVEQPDGRKLLKTLDEMSRFHLAWDPAASETAQSAVGHARRLIERMGRVPLVWKYDHGSAFTSNAFQALLAEHGIAGYPIPPRAPWANGRTERDHQEIGNWLVPVQHLAGKDLDRDIDEGMMMLNFVKPRAVLGYRTSAKTYFDDVGVDARLRKEFVDRLECKMAGSENEDWRRKAIRAILAEMGLYEEWIQAANGSGSVNRTSVSKVAF